MMPIASYLPAWLIKHLPVRVARRLVVTSDSAAAADKSPKQLLVDVSVIYQSDARTGIQRVVRSLLLQLLAAPPEGYQVCPVFATRKQEYSHAAPDFLNNPTCQQSHKTTPISAQHGDLFLGLDLAAHLLPHHQAQLLSWKRNGVSVHVMVYDLLPLQNPEWFNNKTSRNFKRWIKCVAIYADSAICISEYIKVELNAWLCARFNLPSNALPASTIMLGADIEASAPSSGLPPDADFLLARLRNAPAVLMVGTIEPRKAYEQALAAFEQLWQLPGKAPLLVIVGRPGWKTDALQKALHTHPQAGKRLIWLEDASDEYLAQLYAACSGVLITSHAEGFGLPLIEAARHGKPVLARDISVFRETKTAGVEYFDCNTPQLLATSIQHWLKPGLIATYGTANKYPLTWQLSATQLIRALGLKQQTTSKPVEKCVLNSGTNGIAA